MLSLKETMGLLKKYHIPYPQTFLCHDLGEVLENASRMRFPVVLKASSKQETHKTEKGLVQLGIHSLDELSLAFSTLQHKSKNFAVEAFVLQEQERGVEFIIGGQKDSVFNKAVLFGLGGIYAELFEDVSVRVCPLTSGDAISMIQQTHASTFFRQKGFRGKKASLSAVVDVLLKTSRLLEGESVVSLDFNPVIVSEHASVVDARVILE